MTIYQDILQKVRDYDTIIIHRHQNPDPDALGSQVGLQMLLQANFPEKKIKAVGKDEPTLTWIAEMNTVSDQDYEGALVIVTDTANTPRIDDCRYKEGAFLIKIDHHPNDDPYGDLLCVDTNSSSASELIARFAFETDLQLTAEVARLLYIGIVGDTGRFLYPATTDYTFYVASKLRQYDFDFATLARRMDSFPYKIAKLQGYVFDHLEMDASGAARILLTRAILKQFDLTNAETSAIVSLPGKIDTVKVWAIFVEKEDGSYRVRMRSKTSPINGIAKEHDGGGHPLASGANSYSLSENEVIFNELKKVAKLT